MRTIPIILACLAAGSLLSGCGPSAAAPAASPASIPPGPPPLPHYRTIDALTKAGQEALRHHTSGKVTMFGWTFGYDRWVACDYRSGATPADLVMSCTINGPGDLSADPGHDWTAVVAADEVYVQPPVQQQVAIGKAWLHLRPGRTDQLTDHFRDATDQIRANLDFARLVPQDATLVNVTDQSSSTPPKVGYELKVDLRAALAKATDPVERQRLQGLVDRGIISTTYALTMGADDLPVSMTYPRPNPDPRKADVNFTVAFTAWGKDVSAAAPPADLTAEYPRH